MRSVFIVPTMVLAVAVGGCASTTQEQVTKLQFDPAASGIEAQEARLVAQAHSLDELTKDIVRKSTLQGASIGAVAGCTVAMLSVSGAGNCAKGVIVGGVMGAAAGNAHGKKKAREQVALIQRDDLQSSLSRASARLGSVRAGIAEMTTAQDAERAELKAQVASGELSEAAFDARMEEMVETRAQVAEALTTSAERAKQAQQQIAEAQGQGQEGLGWHAEMADEIEQDALSARASISLL